MPLRKKFTSVLRINSKRMPTDCYLPDNILMPYYCCPSMSSLTDMSNLRATSTRVRQKVKLMQFVMQNGFKAHYFATKDAWTDMSEMMLYLKAIS